MGHRLRIYKKNTVYLFHTNTFFADNDKNHAQYITYKRSIMLQISSNLAKSLILQIIFLIILTCIILFSLPEDTVFSTRCNLYFFNFFRW